MNYFMRVLGMTIWTVMLVFIAMQSGITENYGGMVAFAISGVLAWGLHFLESREAKQDTQKQPKGEY